MSKIAIYPGTFDPITFGHIDVIKKSLKLFDKIVVGVSDESNKKYLFYTDERIEIGNKAIFKHLKINKKDISALRGLMLLVSKRSRLLKYLKKTRLEDYKKLVEKLGIRK